MADQKRSVGLVVTTVLPDGTTVAVLQIRGEINPEKLPRKVHESWPGGCQVTAHGRWQEGESDDTVALWREVSEELGPQVAQRVREHFDDLQPIYDSTRPGEEVVHTYHLELPWQFLQEVRLGPASGGLRLVTAVEAANIFDLREFVQQEGAPTRLFAATPALKYVGKLTAMFPDEREAVQRALRVFQG